MEEVTFECSGFHLFRMVKDYTDSDAFFVGETRVTSHATVDEIRRLMSKTGWSCENECLPNQLFLIETRGAVEINILCTRFAWHRRADPTRDNPSLSSYEQHSHGDPDDPNLE